MQSSAAPQPEATPSLRPVAHLERKAAALLLFTIALIVGSGLYLLYARGAFEPTQTLVLTSDDSEGVSVGMDMTFSGFPIGRVSKLELANDGNVRIVVAVPRKDAHWLRESSVFTLVKGIVGGTTIKAYSGILQDPPLHDGAERPVLRGDATAEIPQIVAMAKDLLNNLSLMTAQDSALGKSMDQIRQLGEKLNGKSGAMEVLLGTPENAQKTVEMLERTNQLLARMDHVVQRADQQVFDANGVMPQVRATVETLNQLLKETRGSLKRLDAVLVNAESISTNVNDASSDIGQLRNEVESNLRKIEDMLADLQRKWPFAKEAEVKLP
ncbi:MCE family protein [Comamonas sp. CMM02]|jgi:phospholipid/cholesterol/gamma-HCH transport system substrate-binding protein|uniref:MCE family protein n=2 Tax=Comamonadaceae TaxID=80864 RepID=A0ABR8SD34_9BURK|nr:MULTISPECIES: MlaD family protein [Comamonas]MBD7961391.1 MCE family protein [Comamonas avium]MBD9401972.1 MCE family protein [Comamonas sp. CMM02]